MSYILKDLEKYLDSKGDNADVNTKKKYWHMALGILNEIKIWNDAQMSVDGNEVNENQQILYSKQFAGAICGLTDALNSLEDAYYYAFLEEEDARREYDNWKAIYPNEFKDVYPVLASKLNDNLEMATHIPKRYIEYFKKFILNDINNKIYE